MRTRPKLLTTSATLSLVLIGMIDGADCKDAGVTKSVEMARGAGTAPACGHAAPLSFIAPDTGIEVPLPILHYAECPHLPQRTLSEDPHWGPAMSGDEPSE